MPKVVVIKPNLKYRIKDFNKGRSFVPKVGDIIDLPIENVTKELESRNVRKRLKEELTSDEREKLNEVRRNKKIKLMNESEEEAE